MDRFLLTIKQDLLHVEIRICFAIVHWS